MADVFISYARVDRALAGNVADAIVERGWTAWWDRDIAAGQSFAHAIESQLLSAKCVVVIWTTASAASDWVLNEASEALQRENLIPIAVGDVRPPLGFRHVHGIVMPTTEPRDVSIAVAACLSAIARMLGVSDFSPAPPVDPLSSIRKRVLAAQSREELERQAAVLEVFNTTQPPSANAVILQRQIRIALLREARMEARPSAPPMHTPVRSYRSSHVLSGFLMLLALTAIIYGAWKLFEYIVK